MEKNRRKKEIEKLNRKIEAKREKNRTEKLEKREKN